MSTNLSIVIPVYNGSTSIEALVSMVFDVLCDLQPQVVLVNDCSPDNSEAICLEIARKNPSVTFLSLRKNSGEHNAVICGLNHVTGTYTAIIDDDFQNPPSEIRKLYNHALEHEYDVVFSKYRDKKHSFFRNLGSQLNNRVASWLLSKPTSLYLSSFKLIHYDIVQEIVKYSGPFPYIDGLILRCTNNIGSIYVEHNQRIHGTSNYTFKKLVSLYLNMFINFSVKPIRLFTIFGLVIFLAAMSLAFFVAYESLFLKTTPKGWAFTAIQVLGLNGIEILFLGMIGEYLGKLFLAHNGTPQYTVKLKVNTHDGK